MEQGAEEEQKSLLMEGICQSIRPGNDDLRFRNFVVRAAQVLNPHSSSVTLQISTESVSD